MLTTLLLLCNLAFAGNTQLKSTVYGVQDALHSVNTYLNSYVSNPTQNGGVLISILPTVVYGAMSSDNLNKYAAQIKSAFDEHGVGINEPIQMYLRYADDKKTFSDPLTNEHVRSDDYAPNYNVFTYTNTYLGCGVPSELAGEIRSSPSKSIERFLKVIDMLDIDLNKKCGGKTALQEISDSLRENKTSPFPGVSFDKNKALVLAFLRKYRRHHSANEIAPTNSHTGSWDVGRGCVAEIKEQSRALTKKFGGLVEVESKSCGRCPENTRRRDLQNAQSWIAAHYRPSSTSPMRFYMKYLYLRSRSGCYRHIRVYSLKPLARRTGPNIFRQSDTPEQFRSTK